MSHTVNNITHKLRRVVVFLNTMMDTAQLIKLIDDKSAGISCIDIEFNDEDIIAIKYTHNDNYETGDGFSYLKIWFAGGQHNVGNVFTNTYWANFGSLENLQSQYTNLSLVNKIVHFISTEVNARLDWEADNVEPEHTYE